MSDLKTIVVGYGAAGLESLQALQPPRSVILVEEPDIIRKRDVEAKVAGLEVVDRLIAFEHQRANSASELLAHLARIKVASVVPLTEYATPCAADLSDMLARPGAGKLAGMVLRDKSRLRALTGSHGVRNPRSRQVDSPKQAAGLAREINGPIILKPTDRQGSVGTVIVRGQTRMDEAWSASMRRDEGAMAPDRASIGATLAEEFVEGREFSVEALVRNGEMLFANVTMKELFEGNAPIERAHLTPAPIGEALRKRLVERTGRVLCSVGFQTGIVHCEWIVDSAPEPCLVECAGRFAGDGVIELIERAYDFDIVGAYHRLMRGEDPGFLPNAASRFAMVRFIGGRDGVVERIEKDESVLSLEGVRRWSVSAQPGERTAPPSSSWDRLGAVMVEGPDSQSTIALARRAEAAIRIVYRESAA